MQITFATPSVQPAAAAPTAAVTTARPEEEAWVVQDGVSVSSADLAAGKVSVPADGMKASYTYQRDAIKDATFGAIVGGLCGLILPGIIVPIIGFAASPIAAPIGALLGGFAGAVTDHTESIEGTLKQTANGLTFEPTEAERFGVVSVKDHAAAPVGQADDVWYMR